MLKYIGSWSQIQYQALLVYCMVTLHLLQRWCLSCQDREHVLLPRAHCVCQAHSFSGENPKCTISLPCGKEEALCILQLVTQREPLEHTWIWLCSKA